MPVTAGAVFSSIYHDFVFMTLTPAPPLPLPMLPAILAIGLFLSFSFTWIALRWINLDKKYAYGISGGIALFFIVYLMPIVFLEWTC